MRNAEGESELEDCHSGSENFVGMQGNIFSVSDCLSKMCGLMDSPMAKRMPESMS